MPSPLQNNITNLQNILNQINNLPDGDDSGGLNFEIVGGTSQPSNPTENMIWVNTSTTITSWVFSEEQPSNPSNGMIWVYIGESSNVRFNALKNNVIQICPHGIKQYVNGTWVDKTAKSYQNNEWVDWWNGELYDSGEKYETYTGGWYSRTVSSNSTVSFGSSSIDFNYSDAEQAYAVAATNNKVDMSGYNTLYFDMIVTQHYNRYGGDAIVGVTNSSGVAGNGANSFVTYTNPSVDSVRRNVAVDISGVNDGYVVIHGIIKASVYKIWME